MNHCARMQLPNVVIQGAGAVRFHVAMEGASSFSASPQIIKERTLAFVLKTLPAASTQPPAERAAAGRASSIKRARVACQANRSSHQKAEQQAAIRLGRPPFSSKPPGPSRRSGSSSGWRPCQSATICGGMSHWQGRRRPRSSRSAS